MTDIFFVLLIPFFLGIPVHWILVLFYKIGLGFITRFFYRAVFITEDTLFKQDILWNKPQIRFMLVLLPCMILGIIFEGMLKSVTDISFIKPVVYGMFGCVLNNHQTFQALCHCYLSGSHTGNRLKSDTFL